MDKINDNQIKYSATLQYKTDMRATDVKLQYCPVQNLRTYQLGLRDWLATWI